MVCQKERENVQIYVKISFKHEMNKIFDFNLTKHNIFN